MAAVAISILIGLSVFGIKSMLIFATRNGVVDRLGKATAEGRTHSGWPLQALTTNGRFAKIDQQLNAVGVFLLVFCEDWTSPETTLAGFYSVGAWAASWALIMLDSLRAYSNNSVLAWISIPGVLLFNLSHAVITPAYMAFRLAFTPLPTKQGLLVHSEHLSTLPWAFLLGFCAPIFLLCLPEKTVRGVNLKHTLAGWYQQWNLYTSFFQYALLFAWSFQTNEDRPVTAEKTLLQLRRVYPFIFALAAVPHLIPVLAALAASVQPVFYQKTRSQFLRPKEIFMPANPFIDRKVSSTFEGARWIIQWDVIVSATGMVVWATTLFLQARASLSLTSTISILEVLKLMAWSGLLGGPMGIAVALNWWRDELVLGQ